MNDSSTPKPPDPAPGVRDLVLELNFVPTWARQPPGKDPYAGGVEEERRPRRESDRRDRSRPPRSRDGGRERSGPRRDAFRGERPRRDRRDRPPRGTRVAEEREPPVPLDVFFIPDQERLKLVVNDIRASACAYPLPQLAQTFLTHPDHYLVKLEARSHGGQPPVTLYQCASNGMLFLDRAACLKEVEARHIADHYRVEQVQVDPPSGNFVCVARCGFSGVLLGPPNHHGYNERIEQLYRSRFSRMTLDEYRRRIETVRDPELIEKWKEEFRTHTVYRRVNAAEDEPALTEAQARAEFTELHASKHMHELHRAVVPSRVTHDLRDARLKRRIRDAWIRETRYPVTLVMALRAAFRHMKLHIFKAGKDTAFVTAIEPRTIDVEHTIKTIHDVLDFLAAHPGCSRQELLKGVRPWSPDDPKKTSDVQQHLRWLIDRGHVIEFYNGTLAMPARANRTEGTEN